MSVTDRRNKEKAKLRQKILDVARGIAVADGWQNVTIRKICDKIDYSAPVVYQHFKSKEMILQSLRHDGLKQMLQAFQIVNNKYSLPEKRLLEYGLSWWNFALKNPAIYQVMYNLQGVVCSEMENNQTLVIDFYYVAFSGINQRAKRSEKYRLELCDNLIALIHGFIAIKMVNKIKSGNENAFSVYKNSLQRFIHSINDKNTIV